MRIREYIMYAAFIQIDGVVVIVKQNLLLYHEMSLTWSGGPCAHIISWIVQLAIPHCIYSIYNIIWILWLYSCTYFYMRALLVMYCTRSHLYCQCICGRFHDGEGFQKSHGWLLRLFPTCYIIFCHLPSHRLSPWSHHRLKWQPYQRP